MAAQVGDIIQITAKGISLAEPVVNVYYYQVETFVVGVDPYVAWLNDFRTKVMTPLKAVLNTSTAYNDYTLINVTNNVDYAVLAATDTGTLPGLPVAPHVTFSAQLVRSSRVTRNGSKRFSGLVEEGINGSLINWVAAQKLALENGLAADITTGGALPMEAKAVVVGRIPSGFPNAGDLDLSRINDIASARLGNRVTSQVSRKIPQSY